ncbi:MAG: 1,6-anhydro-N-acetylmuramyl-L-alanine amidase AmpD [Gammaproteobacteria bacterium]|nr:1,6-anhydro-N-acetylmuramyl-L-alanine amidase AmpD [Gammaproteobacteria bacterium]
MKYWVDANTGLARGARFVPSPNCDERPADVTVDVLVIHNISLPPGEFGGPYVEQLFCNDLEVGHHAYFREICEMRVSAHFFIPRGGGLIQFVPVHKRAWHAGESECFGRVNVNDFSIGIELEGTDDSGFEDAQYATLIETSRGLLRAFPELAPDHVFGHSDVAPGRKTDPGPCFDWTRYRRALAEA